MDLESIIRQQEQAKALEITLGTDLLIKLEGIDSYLKSSLVGLDAGSYMIIKTPRVRGLEHRLQPGVLVVVRYLASGKIYGFQSKLLGHVEQPVALMFLSYPEVVSSQDLRKEPRRACQIPAQAQIGGQPVDGILVDLSSCGARFAFRSEGTQPVKVKDQLLLAFQLAGQGQTFNAIVRSVSHEGGKAFLGLEFVDLKPETRQGLEAFLKTLEV